MNTNTNTATAVVKQSYLDELIDELWQGLEQMRIWDKNLAEDATVQEMAAQFGRRVHAISRTLATLEDPHRRPAAIEDGTTADIRNAQERIMAIADRAMFGDCFNFQELARKAIGENPENLTMHLFFALLKMSAERIAEEACWKWIMDILQDPINDST